MFFAAIFCNCILCFLSRLLAIWAIWRGKQYSIMRKQQIIFARCIFLVTLYMFIFTLLILFMVLRQLAIILSDGGLVQDWTGGDSDSNLGLMSNFDRRLKCPSWMKDNINKGEQGGPLCRPGGRRVSCWSHWGTGEDQKSKLIAFAQKVCCDCHLLCVRLYATLSDQTLFSYYLSGCQMS